MALPQRAITFFLNGRKHVLSAFDADTTVLDYLRSDRAPFKKINELYFAMFNSSEARVRQRNVASRSFPASLVFVSSTGNSSSWL